MCWFKEPRFRIRMPVRIRKKRDPLGIERISKWDGVKNAVIRLVPKKVRTLLGAALFITMVVLFILVKILDLILHILSYKWVSWLLEKIKNRLPL